MDRGNLAVADFIMGWLDKNVKPGQQGKR
jgi:hypothetical protein